MTLAEFEALVVQVLGAERAPNPRQVLSIGASLHPATLIVAGPGTGKTSVLVLRALRHLLVDQIAPERILITTFTVKAAKEIRTRLLEWGEPLLAHLRGSAGAGLPQAYLTFLETVDVNRIVTGTLDGVCQEALGEQRDPGERKFVVVEGFAADVLLARTGEVGRERQTVAGLDDYLRRYMMFARPQLNSGDATRGVRTLIDRFVQDEVDIAAYAAAPGPDAPARQAIARIHERYTQAMRTEHRMDFAGLEKLFLERILEGRTPPMLAGVKAILVDEYQDTNPLQERLYLELAKATGAALTVVGDDDQSLYRFRGATIELFRNFAARAADVLQEVPEALLYLVDNYRSAPEITTFYNGFITNDPDFAGARIQPPKPAIIATRPSVGMPVLGMFRENREELATGLANFLEQIFRGGGRAADASLAEAILPASPAGDLGDAVLLGWTVNEFSSSDKARLPKLMRDELQARGLDCFNPRGRALCDVPEVQQLLGLVLMCLEPASPALSIDGVISEGPTTDPTAPTFRLTREALKAMTAWRAAAQALVASNPAPVKNRNLQGVMQIWTAYAQSGTGPLQAASDRPLLDILYAFIPWLPGFRDDPEGQVYLEAISRCAAQAATVSGYRAQLLRDPPHRRRSIWLAIRDVLGPIAEDLVEVDEDIMPSVPRNRLNIMTIHQAKGLEFPLVIVDVGSDFAGNNHAQKFKRFPEEPAPAALMEDDLADCTPIGPLRKQRTDMQRTFEDIIRLYYVAYSRPRSLLLLVGLTKSLSYSKGVKNVATFWHRDENWPWITPATGKPTLANNVPLTLI